jgi:hypothetical protein
MIPNLINSKVYWIQLGGTKKDFPNNMQSQGKEIDIVSPLVAQSSHLLSNNQSKSLSTV